METFKNFREKTKNENFQLSQSTKNVTGGTFGIFKHPICCKISKNRRGESLETKKFEKHRAEKN